MRARRWALSGAAAASALGLAHAEPESPEAGVQEPGSAVIVVTGERRRGEVPGAGQPIEVFDAAAIEALGANDLAEVLAAIAPQTRSIRRRGGGGPVVLLNGRRISGFQEIRAFPREAIERVEVLSEQEALRLGLPADQRVVNVVLKQEFQALTLESDLSTAAEGARAGVELEADGLRLAPQTRSSFALEQTSRSAITQAERGVQRADAPAEAAWRTVAPDERAVQASLALNRAVGERLDIGLDLRHERQTQRALLGLSDAGGPIARRVEDETWRAGLTLNGAAQAWLWTATAVYERADAQTVTGQGDAGDSEASAQSELWEAVYNASGPVGFAPAGAVRLSATLSLAERRQETLAERAGPPSATTLARTETAMRATLSAPLTERDGFGGALGAWSASLTGEARDLSDFGALTGFGASLSWSPIDPLRLTLTGDLSRSAPSIKQLGDPTLITPNVSVFDFARGEDARVTRLTGGAPDLAAEERRDWSLEMGWQTPIGLSLQAVYSENDSRNAIAGLPSLTAIVEQAFPDRVERDGSGRLTTIDRRPINIAERRTRQARWGLSYARPIGQQPGAAGGASGGRGGGLGPWMGGMMGGPGSGAPGRFSLALFHTARLEDVAVLRPGVASLDLLAGDSLGETSLARHGLEANGGLFYRGAGVRFSASWVGESRIEGAGGPLDTLFFDDALTVDLRAFMAFSARPRLVERWGALRGTSLVLRVDNLFDAAQETRDGAGRVPEAFQPGLIRPEGRAIELGLRRQF